MNDLLGALVGEDGKGAGWLIITAILTSGVVSVLVTKLFERGAKRDERVRQGYADSTAALVAWAEFPYRVARRTSDEPDVCATLVGRGHDAQEALACRRAWVVGESVVMSEGYAVITAQLRPHVGAATQAAWRRPPSSGGAGMVLSDGQPLPQVDVDHVVDLWCLAQRYRYGWRRWMLPPVLRWRLRRRGVPFQPAALAAPGRSSASRSLAEPTP